MKKAFLYLIGMDIVLIAIAITNSVVLLNQHPLEYYYTVPGVLIAAVVSIIEAAIVWPSCWWWITHKIVPAYKKDIES